MEAIKHFFAQEEKKTSASFSFMRNQRREAEERMGLGRNGIYYISDKKFYQHYFKLVGIPTFSLGKKKKSILSLIENLVLKLRSRERRAHTHSIGTKL